MRDMELRQEKMVAFLQRAAQNPKFVENIVRMAGVQDFSTLHRKRRLPEADCCNEISDNSFCENSVNSSRSLRIGEVGDLVNHELSEKLKLGLCPTFSDNNLVPPRAQSWNEDYQSLQGREINGVGLLRIECLPLVPETLELSDTGASFYPRKSLLLMTEIDEGGDDGLLSCHLDLTLASSSMQIDRIDQLNRIPSTNDLDVADVVEQRSANTSKEVDVNKIEGRNKREAALPSNNTPLPATGKVNDKFWEQFLTERPGSSDTEEASSSLKEDERNKKR